MQRRSSWARCMLYVVTGGIIMRQPHVPNGWLLSAAGGGVKIYPCLLCHPENAGLTPFRCERKPSWWPGPQQGLQWMLLWKWVTITDPVLCQWKKHPTGVIEQNVSLHDDDEDLGWAPSTPGVSLKLRTVILCLNCSLCTCAKKHTWMLCQTSWHTHVFSQFHVLRDKWNFSRLLLTSSVNLPPQVLHCPLKLCI